MVPVSKIEPVKQSEPEAAPELSAEPEPDPEPIATPTPAPTPSETAVKDGVDGEVWQWDINVHDLRSLISDGDIALISAKDAMSPEYKLKRFTYLNGRWRPGGGDLSSYSLDCRILNTTWGSLYNDLPGLKSSTDRWLIAMPSSFMAIVGDLRASHGEEGFEVQLHTSPGGLIASFTDSSGMPIRTPITIGG